MNSKEPVLIRGPFFSFFRIQFAIATSAPIGIAQFVLAAFSDQIELELSPCHSDIKKTHLLRNCGQFCFFHVPLVARRFDLQANGFWSSWILCLNRQVRYIFKANPFLTTEDNRPRLILTVKGLVHIEDKDILEFQPLTLMDSHELDGIFWGRKRDAGQIVFIFDYLVDHGNEARQTLKAGFFIIIGPKRQGIEVGLALGPIWKSADIVIVIAILINFPKQIIE